MKLGAEPKKMAILGCLALVGGYVFYTNVLSSDTPAPGATKAPAPAVAEIPIPAATTTKVNTFGKKASRSSDAFRPTVKFPAGERPNYATLDPTLRLDLLAKVQAIEPVGGARSLFAFSTAPPPPTPEGLKAGPIIHPKQAMIGPPPPPAPAPVPPPPPPPPITLKFYGYSAPRADGQKRAFFLDGDDIFVASEGELIKKRYRVVQIGVNSVVMEDTQFKNNRQTLILQQEQVG
jgi:hypothetical protein